MSCDEVTFNGKRRRAKPADDKRTDQMSELSMVEKTHVNNLLKRRLRSVLFLFSANFY